MSRPLHLSLSAGPLHLAILAKLDARYAAHPRAVMVYEQFVCTEKAQTPERILSVDRDLIVAELARLAPRVRPGDVLVANVEDGHPFYGEPYAKAVGEVLGALGAFETPSGRRVGSGAYGLWKANQSATDPGVWHAKAPFKSPMVDLDRAAEKATAGDTHLIAELYPANVSSPAGGQPGRVSITDQRAWIRRDLQRVRYYAAGRPVLAFVNRVYGGKHDKSGRQLTSFDRRLILEEIAAIPTAMPALWIHLEGSISEATVINEVNLWGQDWASARMRAPASH